MSRFLTRRQPPAAEVPEQPGTRPDTADRHWHELLKSAAALARAAGDPDEAIAWAIALIRDYSGWCLGHALLFDPLRDTLRSTGVWQSDAPARFTGFVCVSEEIELQRGVGLPGRALERGQPVWIRDVQDDDNFPRRVEAAKCGLHAAAAAPIPSARGTVGVLEFFSDDVVELDPRFLDLISHVAGQLGVIVDRSRDVRDRATTGTALRRSEQDLADAQRLAHIGSWSWDVGDDQVIWSAELHRIYGLAPDAGPVSFDEYLSRVHPDDRDRVSNAVAHTMQTLEPYEHEYRIVWPDGRVRWVHAAGAVSAAEDGQAKRLGGFCHDITEQHEAEDRRRRAQDELESHRETLERIARGERVEITLDLLCRDIEQRFPGAHCTILTAVAGERLLRHAAAPSLSATFCTAIDGMRIHEGAGACGTAAARGEEVVVRDVFLDKLTEDFVELARLHDLRSVWSRPLFSATGQLLGTFAVYRAEVHEPTAEE
jgi:PAS domain S-box-containing protein